MAVELSRRLFNVDEFLQMIEAGVFQPDERVELIDGEVVQMSPIGDPHAEAVMAGGTLFATQAGSAAVVNVQNPLRLGGRSRPQPDIALLRPPLARYRGHPPSAEDALLVVEVSETSLAHDRDVKMPAYARANIPEAWLVDLVHDLVRLYREPTPEGYQVIQTARRGETIAPAAFPHWRISVDDLLPAR